VEFRILGPLSVIDSGTELELGPAKQRALLALLLLHGNEAVSSERLIEWLWGEQAPATAHKSLQVYVSGIRKALGEASVETRGRSYALRLEEDELDAQRFRALVEEAMGCEPRRKAELLVAGLELFRGEPLPELRYADAAQAEIARLEELRQQALEERIEADLACGRHRELLPELEGLVAEHPLRERLRAQLMLALYRSGRQADALAVYRNGRALLLEELGLDPGPN
jgi:DNA-binding SARP family transcriptional activator